MATSPLPLCKQVKADGTPCQANARPGSDWCIFHDPALAGRRAEARRAGGRERSRKAAVLPAGTADAPLATAGDVAAFLGQTINQVRKGQLDPKVGNCLGVLAGVLLRALEEGDLAEQLLELRRQVEGLGNARRDVAGGVEPAEETGGHEGVGGPAAAAGAAAAGPGGDRDPGGDGPGPVADGLAPLF
jgi:hypothetical protein